MNIGKQILSIRQERELTQEGFGKLYHVTRQTVSNWENEKSYPDLQTLVDMSEMFDISLDKLLKEDSNMIKTIDKERIYGTIAKRDKTIINIFTGAGTGLVISCLLSSGSIERTIVIYIGIIMIVIGWFRQSKYDRAIIKYIEEQDKV